MDACCTRPVLLLIQCETLACFGQYNPQEAGIPAFLTVAAEPRHRAGVLLIWPRESAFLPRVVIAQRAATSPQRNTPLLCFNLLPSSADAVAELPLTANGLMAPGWCQKRYLCLIWSLP